jgi:hypothetical protein
MPALQTPKVRGRIDVRRWLKYARLRETPPRCGLFAASVDLRVSPFDAVERRL